MATIKAEHKGDMLFETVIGNHRIAIDVPSSMGGQDRGSTPPQIFIASLASCIAAFVTNYCHNKKINTKDLSVEVSFDKLTNPSRLGNIKVSICIPNADWEKNKQAILKVANLCPVHQTLEVSEKINITITK